MDAYERKIRTLVSKYLRKFRLPHKLTRLEVVDQPLLLSRKDGANYTGRAFACVQLRTRYKFHLTIEDSIPSSRLPEIIAHEIAHLPLEELKAAVADKSPRRIERWEEQLADLLAVLAR